jgi:predicted transcriptional regulator
MTKKNRAKDLPDLSRLEQEIMSVVWDLGECSSAEVIEAYTQKRELAKTTIRTVIANLLKKGYIEQVPSMERGYRYRACVSRDAVAKRSLKQLVSGLFSGSPRQAIAYLLKEQGIENGDLDEIRKMLDKQRRGGGRR